MTLNICRHWQNYKCNERNCTFLHLGPGGIEYCKHWSRGNCAKDNCSYIHGTGPPPLAPLAPQGPWANPGGGYAPGPSQQFYSPPGSLAVSPPPGLYHAVPGPAHGPVQGYAAGPPQHYYSPPGSYAGPPSPPGLYHAMPGSAHGPVQGYSTGPPQHFYNSHPSYAGPPPPGFYQAMPGPAHGPVQGYQVPIQAPNLAYPSPPTTPEIPWSPNTEHSPALQQLSTPPTVDPKKVRCPTLDRERRCVLEDACPYSHEEYMVEYFDRLCPAELHGHVCESRDSACPYRQHKPVTDKTQEEEQQAKAQASSPPTTVWRTNPVIVDGTCGRRPPKRRNDNGPDKAKKEEHADAAPVQAASVQPAPAEPAPVEVAPVEPVPAEPVATNTTSSGPFFRVPRERQPGMADSQSEAGDTATYQSWADEVEEELFPKVLTQQYTQ